MAITNVTEALEALKDLTEVLPDVKEAPLFDLKAMGLPDLDMEANLKILELTDDQVQDIIAAANSNNIKFHLTVKGTDIVISPTITDANGSWYAFSAEVFFVGAINITISGKWLSAMIGTPASSISGGTFAGKVVANATKQTPETSLLRNSKIVSSETNPTVNGEIVWQYE